MLTWVLARSLSCSKSSMCELLHGCSKGSSLAFEGLQNDLLSALTHESSGALSGGFPSFVASSYANGGYSSLLEVSD